MADIQRPETLLRALTVFDALPDGCIAFEVRGDDSAPHLRSGEFAVCDTNDREPQHGEVYLHQWSRGTREILQVVQKPILCPEGGVKPAWWSRPLAASNYSNEQRRHMIDRALERGGEAVTQVFHLCSSDGPKRDDHMREQIVGRVIGVLNLDAGCPQLSNLFQNKGASNG